MPADRDVFSGSEVASCVTNASLNVGVGVTVASTAKGMSVAGVSVGIVVGTGDGNNVGVAPPSGVGVAYRPHSVGLPPQEARRKDAAIRTLVRRFTK